MKNFFKFIFSIFGRNTKKDICQNMSKDVCQNKNKEQETVFTPTPKVISLDKLHYLMRSNEFEAVKRAVAMYEERFKRPLAVDKEYETEETEWIDGIFCETYTRTYKLTDYVNPLMIEFFTQACEGKDPSVEEYVHRHNLQEDLVNCFWGKENYSRKRNKPGIVAHLDELLSAGARMDIKYYRPYLGYVYLWQMNALYHLDDDVCDWLENNETYKAIKAEKARQEKIRHQKYIDGLFA